MIAVGALITAMAGRALWPLLTGAGKSEVGKPPGSRPA